MKKKLLLSLLPMALLAGCFEDSGSDSVLNPGSDSGTGTSVFVVATDYKSYQVQKIQGTAVSDVYNVGNDAALSVADGVLYVINRSKAVVTAYRGGIADASHLVFQVSVGTGTNPYQVTKAGGKLYVTRFAVNSLLVLNAASGDSIGSIDLSAFANADGLVSPVQTEFVDGKLWILAQATTKTWGYDTARVLFADTNASRASSGIALKLLNPQNMAVLSGKVYVSSRGTYDTVANAGIEVVDVATRTREKTLTGPMGYSKTGKLAVASGKLWVVTNGAWPAAEAVPVNLSTGALGTAVGGFPSIANLTSDGSNIWLSDRTDGTYAVVKIDPLTGAVLSSVKTALKPDAIAVMP